MDKSTLILKRAFDIIIAVIALIALSPLLALIALAIRLDSPGPVFFRQERLGRQGRIFKIWKFRSMVVGAQSLGLGVKVVEDDPRITLVGSILRRCHLDELPQLINVLKGDMAIIGPRPGLPFHYDYYKPWERKRLSMRPGITGWAQIHGANRINWDDRIELDVWYVKNWSLWLDLKIALMTSWHIAARLLRRKKDTYQNKGQELWTRGFPDDLFTNSLYNTKSDVMRGEND